MDKGRAPTVLGRIREARKGSWKAIAENYVCTRTPVQVASHAQKYFLKFAASDKKRKR